MNINKKLASLVIISSFLVGSAYAMDAPKTSKEEPKMKMEMKMPPMDKEMEGMMKMNFESSDALVNMGFKMLKDANVSADAEKMISGAKMMKVGMDLIAHHMAHMGMMKINVNVKMDMKHHMKMKFNKEKHEKMMKEMHEKKMKEMMDKMGITKEKHENMKKMFSDASKMLMTMGNKLIVDGNKEGNTDKMFKGGELASTGSKMFHMGMMKQPMMGSMPKMMEIEQKIEIKDK